MLQHTDEKKPTGSTNYPAGHTDGAIVPAASSASKMTNTPGTHPLVLVPTKTEPRVDSRLLAKQLGIKHPNLFAQVKTHKADFEQFGKVTFQTGALPSGQSEKFATLNEDQAYLLLTYSRNTAKVRALKIKLVKAFSNARRAAAVRQTEYLPSYHAMSDRIHELAQGSPNERFLHMNTAKLVNQVAGIEAGQRPGAPLPKQSVLAVAHMLAAGAIEQATDRHQIQGLVKKALAPLAALAAPQRLQGGAA